MIESSFKRCSQDGPDGSGDGAAQLQSPQPAGQQIRDVFAHAPVGMAITDVDGRFLQVNSAFCEITGYTEEELKNRNSTSIIHPDDVERSQELRQRLADGELPHYTTEKRYIRKSGEPSWVRLSASPIRDSGGRLTAICALLENISPRKRAEQALSTAAEQLRRTQIEAGVGVWEWDVRRRRLTASEGNTRLFGIPVNGPLNASHLLGSIHPEDRPRIPVFLRRVALDGHQKDIEFRVVWPDGSVHWLLSRAHASRDEHGHPLRLAGITIDITERKRAEEALHESEHRFRRVFEDSAMGMAVVSPDGTLLKVNPALCQMLLYTEEELQQGSPEINHFADSRQYLEQSRRLQNGELNSYSLERRYLRKDGTVMWGRLTSSAIRNPSGELLYSIHIVEDVTDRRAAEDQLAYQAQHDVLTGLPNRRLLEDRLQQAIAYAKRGAGVVGLFYIDLDSFKIVNDSLGHTTGDVLLQQVAIRLRAAVRESDTLARNGGDEFVLLAADLKDARTARLVAEKLRRSLKEPFRIGAHELFVTASIGISLYPQDASDSIGLQRNADVAMYDAKRTGKDALRFFNPKMSRAAVARLRLENQLRRALDNGQLALVYQPQFRVKQPVLSGFEALLRWMHPSGPVPPSDFIPIAEETGLIIPIGTWVLEEACRQIGRWTQAGCQPVRVAVNVSEVQFARPDFVKTVSRCIAQHGINASLLELELTETLLMTDLTASASKMAELHELGVSIAIDDFGTGYSSLSYLQRLPIDALKIDRSFVRDVGHEARAVPLLRAMVSLCQSLNVRVLVEGIETPRQMELVREIGCDEAQGYLLGVPAPLHDFLIPVPPAPEIS